MKINSGYDNYISDYSAMVKRIEQINKTRDKLKDEKNFYETKIKAIEQEKKEKEYREYVGKYFKVNLRNIYSRFDCLAAVKVLSYYPSNYNNNYYFSCLLYYCGDSKNAIEIKDFPLMGPVYSNLMGVGKKALRWIDICEEISQEDFLDMIKKFEDKVKN